MGYRSCMTHTYEVHNNSSVGGDVISKFMEVPLGWCDVEVRVYDARTFHITVKQTETGGQTATANITQLSSDSTYTYGVNAPYYQWGRKDPLLPSNGMGNIVKPFYDNQYAVFSRQNGTVSTGVSIQHPNIFYFVLDGSWSSTNSLEFWNKGNTATNVNNNPVYKTVYDPAPDNFLVPKPAAFTGFTTTGNWTETPGQYNVSGSFNNGWNFYSKPNFTGDIVFFPALGYLDVGSTRVTTSTAGKVSGVGTECNYWMSGPSTSYNTIGSGFDPKGIYPAYIFVRSNGYSFWPTQ